MFETGQIVLGHTWEGRNRPAVYIERRGSGHVVLPFTTRPRQGNVAVADWHENRLHRPSWLWGFMQRADDLTLPPEGVLWITSQLAGSIVKRFAPNLSPAVKAALLAAPKKREKK